VQGGEVELDRVAVLAAARPLSGIGAIGQDVDGVDGLAGVRGGIDGGVRCTVAAG
jgi:hypothetical protein